MKANEHAASFNVRYKGSFSFIPSEVPVILPGKAISQENRHYFIPSAHISRRLLSFWRSSQMMPHITVILLNADHTNLRRGLERLASVSREDGARCAPYS